MITLRRPFSLFASLALLSIADPRAAVGQATSPATLISVNGGIGALGSQGVGPGIQDFEYLCSGWTLTASFTNLSYTLAPGALNYGSGSTLNYFLLNSLGTSATSNNIIWSGSTAFLSGGAESGSTPVFSGINLGPGTYYLVFVPSTEIAFLPAFSNHGRVVTATNNAGFNGTFAPAYNAANATFPPASSWWVAGISSQPGSGDGPEDLAFTLVQNAVAPSPTNIVVSPGGPVIGAGTNIAFVATGYFTNGTASTLSPVGGLVWTSSNPGVATVDANGNAAGISPGTTAITANLGGISNGVTLTVVAAPSVTSNPSSQNVSPGATASFSAGIGGSGLSYQWTFYGTNLPGANSATLTITNVSPSNTGPYALTAVNAAGSVASSPAILTVVDVSTSTLISVNGGVGAVGLQGVGPGIQDFEFLCSYWASASTFTNLSYTLVPNSLYYGAGTTVTFLLLNAIGPSATSNNIIWSGSRTYASAGWETGTTPVFGGLTLGPGTYYLVLIPSAEITFAPAFGNGHGRVVSTAANVTYDGTLAPAYNAANTAFPPASTWWVAGQSLAPGSGDGLEDLAFSLVQTSATPVPTAIVLSPASFSAGPGTNQAFTATAQFAAGGSFGLSATNGLIWSSSNPAVASVDANGVATALNPGTTTITANFGGATGSASLTVLAAPSIIAGPLDVTVAPGAGTTLSVSAAGSGLSYQWAFNGINITGATSPSLTISNISVVNSGAYTVTVSNSAGVVTSQYAIVAAVDLKMFAGVIVDGPVGSHFLIQGAPNLQSNWITLTNLVLPSNPYIFIDYNSATNGMQFYRAVPQ